MMKKLKIQENIEHMRNLEYMPDNIRKIQDEMKPYHVEMVKKQLQQRETDYHNNIATEQPMKSIYTKEVKFQEFGKITVVNRPSKPNLIQIKSSNDMRKKEKSPFESYL